MPELSFDWRSELADRVRTARGLLSQAELASRSGVSDRTISMIEMRRLKNPPRIETVVRLALATRNDPIGWCFPLRSSHQQFIAEEIRRIRNALPGSSLLSRGGQESDSDSEIPALRREVAELRQRVAQLESPTRSISGIPFF